MQTQSRRFHWTMITLLSIGAAVVIWTTTTIGPGVSPDSTIYLATARGIVHGQGWVSPTEGDSAIVPMTHYPPLYPLAIASGKAFRLPPLQSARLINAIMFAITVSLAAMLAMAIAGETALGTIAAVVVSTSASLLTVYTFVYSEPMTIVFTLGTLLMLNRFYRRATWTTLLAASAMASAACLTRYAGVALVLAGTLTLLKFGRRRWVDAITFVAIALIPLGCWLFRNHLVAGTIASRQVEPHVGSRVQLISLFITLTDVVAPLAKIGLLISLLAALAGVIWLSRNSALPKNPRAAVSPTVFTIIVFIFSHLLLVAIVVEPGRPLDVRLLSPLTVPLIVLGIVSVAQMIRRSAASRLQLMLAAAMLAAIVSANLAASKRFLRNARSIGLGMNKPRWRNSAVMAELMKHGRKLPILSNSPDGLLFIESQEAGWRYDDRKCLRVRLLPSTAQSVRELLPEGGWICYMSGNSRIVVTQDELRQLPGLRLKMRDGEGFRLYSLARVAAIVPNGHRTTGKT